MGYKNDIQQQQSCNSGFYFLNKKKSRQDARASAPRTPPTAPAIVPVLSPPPPPLGCVCGPEESKTRQKIYAHIKDSEATHSSTL